MMYQVMKNTGDLGKQRKSSKLDVLIPGTEKYGRVDGNTLVAGYLVYLLIVILFCS